MFLSRVMRIFLFCFLSFDVFWCRLHSTAIRGGRITVNSSKHCINIAQGMCSREHKAISCAYTIWHTNQTIEHEKQNIKNAIKKRRRKPNVKKTQREQISSHAFELQNKRKSLGIWRSAKQTYTRNSLNYTPLRRLEPPSNEPYYRLQCSPLSLSLSHAP